MHQMGLRELARLTGYGNNHQRIRNLYVAKYNAETINKLVSDDSVAAKFKSRKDKLTDLPIWTAA